MADDATQVATPPAAAPAQQPPAQIDTDNPQVSATIPDAPQPTQQAPTVLIPEKRGGLAGIVDEFRNAVAGTSTPQTYIDPSTGQRYIQHPPSSPGQQWARIGATALRGAAAGLQNGQGRGGSMRAAGAGINVGLNQGQQQFEKQDEAAQQDYERDRQAKLDRANDQINTAKLVFAQLANTRMQVKGTQDDIDWSDTRQKNLEAGGARLVGYAGNVSDLARIQREDEQDLLKHHFQNNTYVTVPQYNADGQASGIAIYAKSPGWGEQLAPQDTTIPIFQPPSKPGEAPTRKDVTPTVPMTNNQIQTYENLYDQQMTNWQKTKAEADLKAAQTATQHTEAAKNTAQAGEAQASAFKDTQEGNRAAAETTNLQQKVGSGGDQTTLATSIANGHITPDRMGYLLARNPQLLQQVQEIDPDFDGSKAESYPATYKEFTSTKPGTAGSALNSGGAALGHLKELRDLNTVESHIPGTPAWTAYQNKADTVAMELARFYGDSTVPGIASIKKTLTANLPGGRDAAIRTQAQSMGDKLDSYEQTWRNAAPSSKYEAPMPGLSQKALAARAALDPTYANRRVKEVQQNPQAAAVAPPQAAPATHAFSVSAWQKANPQGDANAAKAAALKQGYQVVN